MKLNSSEYQAISTIGLIISLRLLGIFLILPVFSVYAVKYPGATLTLAGVAFGIYALAQSALQIPFGWASDRFGRKPALLIGLSLFTVGSLVCGMAENMNQLILARILQGSGAVGSVAIAALGDLTRHQVRAQAFTFTGIIIGLAFVIGLLAGPLLAGSLGFPSLFYILAGLGFLSIIVTVFFFPEIDKEEAELTEKSFISLIKRVDMRQLYVAAFVLSFVVNLFFFIYPLSWTELGVDRAELWRVYLVILLPSAIFAFPYVRYAEKRGMFKPTTWAAWVLMGLSFFVYLAGGIGQWILYLTGGIFFLGHTIFQALLPAFLTQRVGYKNRGSATGFYNLANFFGAALGGMLAGQLYNYGHSLPLVVGLALLSGWLLIGLPEPPGQERMG